MKRMKTELSEIFDNQINRIQEVKKEMEEIQDWLNYIYKHRINKRDDHEQYSLALSAIEEAIDQMEVCSCAIEDQIYIEEEIGKRLNRPYTEYFFYDAFSKTRIYVNELSKKAQEIVCWYAEADGTPERLIDFIVDSFDGEDFNKDTLSEFIIAHRDDNADIVYNEFEHKYCETFNELVSVRARREFIENGEPLD